jgi:hypothetical protein
VTNVVFLGRVVVLAAHESCPSGDDSVGVAQQLLHDPGAAPSENRDLGVVAHLHPLHRRKSGYFWASTLINGAGRTAAERCGAAP